MKPGSSLLLRLHGEPALTLPGGRSVALEPRAAALLALASLECGVTRLRAAMLLWPDSKDARRNLRQQLLRFRQQLGRDILVGDETLALADDIVLEPDAAPHLPLLGRVALDGCDDFSAWLAERRREARAARVKEARRRLAAAEAEGDLDAALDAVDALLATDVRDEAHHLECMRLHFLAGDTTAGLAAFERLERMLRDEFGTRPSAASAQMAEALRRARRGADAAAAGAAVLQRPHLPVTLLRPPAVVGRQTELRAAERALAEGRVVCIEGDAGLGKSRLVAELLARRRGGAVLAGAGRPGDAGAPYATLERLLRRELAAPPAALSEASRAVLRRLGLHASHGFVPAPASALRPGELAAAVAEWLRLQRVALVVLDDLHFADEATLDLVAGLAAHAPVAPGWLLAARPAESSAAARALRASLIEIERMSVVKLAPLDTLGVAALVDGLGIDGLRGDALAEPLSRHTGGNPLFVLETLKLGLHDGSLRRGVLPRPPNVAALIELRLARLSEPALTLARVAAIAGVGFSIELAEAAIGVPAVHLASPWQELHDAQVLRDETFAHDLVSDAVLSGVPQVVARRVHGQCAQWLAARDSEPARLARHWAAAGRAAEAGRAFVAAARRADATARLQDEASLLAQAAEAFAAAGLDDERFEALCARARALTGADAGDATLHEVRALVASAAGAAQSMRAQRELVGLLVERGDTAASIEEGHRLLALARRNEDHGLMVRTACHMATALCRLGRAHEAAALLLPLREWVLAQPDDALRMLWHGDWAAALGHLGRLAESVLAFDDARAAARRLELPDAEGRLMMNCAVTLRMAGRFGRALELARAGHAQSAPDTADATHVAIARLVIARDECALGCYAIALAALEEIVPQFDAAGLAFWAQAARMVLATLWMHLGQPARATPLLRHDATQVPAWLQADRLLLRLDLAQLLRQRTPTGVLDAGLTLAAQDPQRQAWLRVRSLRHLSSADALREADELGRELAASERLGVRMALEVHVARAALAGHHVEQAEDAADGLVRLFDDGCVPDGVYHAEAWWVAAQAFGAAGRSGDAARALQRGTQWVTQQALPQVPPPFIDSFLHRNPVNRDLLAAASR